MDNFGNSKPYKNQWPEDRQKYPGVNDTQRRRAIKDDTRKIIGDEMVDTPTTREALDIELLKRDFPAIANAIKDERVRQIIKWGDRPLSSDTFCRIMGEEFGEVCNAVECVSIAKEGPDELNAFIHLREELVQVAAVAVRFIQTVDYHIKNSK